MKKIAIVLVAVLLVANVVSAQDVTAKTKKGDRAWMFTLNGLDNLGAGDYMQGVGLRYYFQDMMAIRAGIGFSTASVSGASDNPMKFSLNAGLQYDYAVNGPVVAYVGGLLAFSSDNPAGPTDATTTFGVAGVAGVEWFPWSNVSLSPEYQLAFSSMSPPGGGSSSSFTLGSAGSFGLSFYF